MYRSHIENGRDWRECFVNDFMASQSKDLNDVVGAVPSAPKKPVKTSRVSSWCEELASSLFAECNPIWKFLQKGMVYSGINHMKRKRS